MKCKINQSLMVAVVFILAAACLAKANSLIEAASNADTEKVQTLLGRGADVNPRKEYNGNTALMCAAFNGRTDTVQVLLGKGADINAQAIMGDTALTQAKKMGHKEIAQMLKQAGAKE